MDVPALVSPLREVATTEGISLPRLFFSSYEHSPNARLLLFARAATGVEAMIFSYIEEMIMKLVQPEGLEVSATGMLSEGTATVVGEPSSQSSLPKDLLFSESSTW